MLEAVVNTWRLPDLRRKLLWTLLICVVYLFATHVPIPGFTHTELETIRESKTAESGLFRITNIFTGGALANTSVVALGLFPLLEAQGLLAALQPFIPTWGQMLREPGGRERFWRRYVLPMTLIMAAFSAWAGDEVFLPQLGKKTNWLDTLTIVTTLTAGTMFMMWLSDLITDGGLGNGRSILFLAAILSQLPLDTVELLNAHGDTTRVIVGWLVYAVFMVGMIWFTVLFQEGVRRVPVQYGKRVRGEKRYGGGSSSINLKLFTVSINEPFQAALALLSSVYLMLNVLGIQNIEANANMDVLFPYLLGPLVFVLAYLLISHGFSGDDTAENLARNGGFVPGIRPGRRTAHYFNHVMRSMAFVGAMVMTCVCLLPFVYQAVMLVIFGSWEEPMYTLWAWWTVPGIIIDTVRQLEAQLMMRGYGGLFTVGAQFRS